MILTAIPVGFVAGLFGIGGGLIMVPFLFYIFGSLGINPEYLMHLAVGTSFAIIIPTSFVSVLTHLKYKAVDIGLVKIYGIFSVIVFLRIYLLFLKEKESNISISIDLKYKAFFGILSGFISAPMGIGGAVMNVPIFKFFGYSINRAIGSGAAIGFLIALFGATGFLISGNYLDANLMLSVGFINIPAFLIFIPITTIMARIGAKTVHKIDRNKVSKYFGLLLIAVSSKFFFDYFSF